SCSWYSIPQRATRGPITAVAASSLEAGSGRGSGGGRRIRGTGIRRTTTHHLTTQLRRSSCSSRKHTSSRHQRLRLPSPTGITARAPKGITRRSRPALSRGSRFRRGHHDGEKSVAAGDRLPPTDRLLDRAYRAEHSGAAGHWEELRAVSGR